MFESRPTKILLCVCTIIPIVYMVYFISTFFTSFDSPPGAFDKDSFDTMFKIHIAVMGLSVLLLVAYLSHLFRTKAVPNDKKALWAVVLFFGSYIAMLIYWFIYIWRSPLPSSQE